MKRLLLLLACLLALCTTVVAAEPAISDMKTDCTLTGSGACQVTQTFTMEIDGAQTQLRFPLVPGAKKASVAGYDAQKQTDGDCPVLVLSDASGFTGTRSFTVLYTVSGLVSEADGVQTLQLPLLSAKWAYPISRYQFTVTMPKPFEGYPAFVSGYYSDVISDYIDLDVSESLISGTIATGLKDHESLDMTLTLDKSYFSGAYTALSFSWVGMAVIVALLALAFGYWFVTLRSAPIRTSTRRLPPDAALPCDMPFLVGGGPIQFNMLVCHWASLGYLTIFCGKNGRVALRRRVDMGNERRQAEVRLFQMLFSQGDVCEGASLLYKRTAEKADAVLRRYWVRKLYRKSSGNPLLARAFGLLAGALAAAEAASPLLPAGFVRWLLLIAAFLIGGALSAVILHAPSAYYQAVCGARGAGRGGASDARAVRRGSARRAARDRVSGAARASDAPRRQADGLRRRDRHAGDELPPLPAPRHAEPAALAARAGQPVFLPHPPLRRGHRARRGSGPDARQYGARAVRLVSGAAAPAAHGRRVLQSPAGGAGPAGAFDPEIKRDEKRLPQQRQALFSCNYCSIRGQQRTYS